MDRTLPIQIVRRQFSRGERVEIAITGQAALVWSAADGASSTGGSLTTLERLLVERLVLDSADQFILSQLRGASYQVVARNVRGESGGADDYRGPTWDVIRIDDPDDNERRRPLSSWRLYYINSSTGLIDRVVYEFAGESVEATFAEWMTQNGEVSPRHITWRQNGRIVLDLHLTSFICIAD